ncbi:cation diffusion facilitator family transporter [Oscillatoria sp. HE19RPO]|uniref:cation diffusion facilitator family transporter n=1 Tax=Oscillatoria sp. HE19RPO TaxID=2954806 RepID=UPI0020C436B3|nr:cation diffusion facilitator family transporter [Oscillatoria sp. HE19RPO]
MTHHHHNHTHANNTTRNIKFAFLLNLGFTIFELIGGFWTNSLAIMSDALHDLGDSFSLGLSWYLEKYSQRGRTNKYSYGYRRFSLLGAAINAIVLSMGSLIILSEAIPRLFNPEPADAQGMVLFAIVGVIVNGMAVLRLRGSQGMSARVVSWHLLEDVLGWIAVLIVSIVLLFSNLYILDPLLSIGITLYVLYNALRNLKSTVEIFLQATPSNVNVKEIETQICEIERVKSTHHTHVWSQEGENNVMTTHVVVDKNATKAEILEVKRRVKDIATPIALEHITVEIEYENEECNLREHEEPHH